MESKTTDQLNHEIRMATDIKDYLKENKNNLLTTSLCKHLNMLLSQKSFAKQTSYTIRSLNGPMYIKYSPVKKCPRETN